MNFSEELEVHLYQPAAVLKVTGEDAQSFLQGQFTQDLKRPPYSAAYGLWLNQKGKVVADSFVLSDSGQIWVISLFSAAAVILERLSAYIIADDVNLEDVTHEWSGAAVIGAGADGWLTSPGELLPSAGQFSRPWDGLLFRGRRDTQENWEWLLPRARLAEFEVRAAAIRHLEAAHVERLRIRAGIPAIPADIGGKDLPNEGGLEQAAISYSKGCYLGQEVMARLKAMGQVRRRLVQVRGTGSVPWALPVELFAGDKKIGELRSAAPDGDGFVGLALVSLLNLNLAAGLNFAGENTSRVHLLKGVS